MDAHHDYPALQHRRRRSKGCDLKQARMALSHYAFVQNFDKCVPIRQIIADDVLESELDLPFFLEEGLRVLEVSNLDCQTRSSNSAPQKTPTVETRAPHHHRRA